MSGVGPDEGDSEGASCAVDLQGHRGARGLFPENTLEGFRQALALGVTTLEMDVGLTQDGVVVVHHDERLAPHLTQGSDGRWLTAPTAAIRELRWEQLASYDVGRIRPGSEYAGRFPEQRGRDGLAIPRLGEVIAMAEAVSSGIVRYNVETKLSPLHPALTAPPEMMADAVLSVLHRAGVAGRATIQSFDWRTLRHVQRVAPAVQTACLTTEQTDPYNVRSDDGGPSKWTAGLELARFDGSVPRLVQAAGCRVWSPFFRDLSAADLQHAHQLGLRVAVWTVNSAVDITAMLDLGVDAIISDYPDRVRAELERRGCALPIPRSSY